MFLIDSVRAVDNMSGRIWVDKKRGRKPGRIMDDDRKLSMSIAMKKVRLKQKLLREKYNAGNNA